MFQDPSVAAVIIATPARYMQNLLLPQMNEGKAVIFVKKPMAITLEEADKAILAGTKANVPLQIGFNRRFVEGFRAAHK